MTAIASPNVVVWNKSANFDGDQFPDPGRFGRSWALNWHLSFACGPHYCMGAALASIELTALFAALREFVPDMSVTGTPLPVYSNFGSGFHSLPVRLEPRAERLRGISR